MMPADDTPEGCWRGALAALRGLPADEQIAEVQRIVNRLPYVSDQQNWGTRDRWETPGEMFARGGDCEGFALTKYFALRELGFEEAALRIAIVWDQVDREQHAVLFVDAGGMAWVLDNKFATPVPAAAIVARYRMIWSANHDGASVSTTASGKRAGRIRLTNGGTTLVIRARPRRRAGG
jgi:predicted transglutaminase-like cysteine proteinase